MLHRERGEMGELVAAAELAKHGVGVAWPLGDELPFDLVLHWEGRLFRAQVKSARPAEGAVRFNLASQNSTRYRKYTEADCDVMVLCDYERAYLLGPGDFSGRRGFTVRLGSARNGQVRGTHGREDYAVSPERVEAVLGPSPGEAAPEGRPS